jgi:anaerobic selenocysteine-containing dehydrogenase
MCPDQQAVFAALARDDVFTVVHEQVMTDTTRFADVVLPATTAFEIDDAAASYGSLMVQPVRAVIAPVGESRSNDAVGLTLANAYGFEWTDPGVEPAIADLGPRVVGVPSRQFVDTFPSFDGRRAQLVDPEQGVPRYVPLQCSSPNALTLISPATSKLVNSMFGEFQSPSPAIQLHPDDAAERGLSDGDLVCVANAQSSITVPLSISAATRPGVAVMSKGVWLRHHPDGHGVNALTPATGDALVNGACFNDTQVEVSLAALQA